MKTLPFLLILVLVGCAKESISNSDNTFSDSRDNHVYKSVIIGTQTWMAENLAYLPSVVPSSDGLESFALYYVYDYEGRIVSEAKKKRNYTLYGVLYNWEAAKVACPSGWHLPTDKEWKILETYLGMSQTDADRDYVRDSGSIGKAMKSINKWSYNRNGDNSSGFSALPGGDRIDRDPGGVLSWSHPAGFSSLGRSAYFWSSSKVVNSAWSRNLVDNSDGVLRETEMLSLGFSVRCLKD